MDKTALPVTAPSGKSGTGRTALLLARIAVVYYFVSLFVSALNPIAVNSAVVDFPLQQVFGDISSYTSGLTTGGFGYYSTTTLTAAAYILLITLVLLCISLVLSVFDGTPKKVAVISMAVNFGVTAACCVTAGVMSYTLGGMAVSKPYSFLAAVLFAAAAVCCVVSLCSKSGASMYDKNVDPSTLGGKLTGYFAGSVAEIKKIVWPDRKTVLKNTGVVLLFILAIGAVIWLTDFLWSFLFSLILG